MEKVIPNEAAPIINKLNEDDIPRCIDCNLICSLQLNYNDGKPLINFECENNHKGNILLKDSISINELYNSLFEQKNYFLY